MLLKRAPRNPKASAPTTAWHLRNQALCATALRPPVPFFLKQVAESKLPFCNIVVLKFRHLAKCRFVSIPGNKVVFDLAGGFFLQLPSTTKGHRQLSLGCSRFNYVMLNLYLWDVRELLNPSNFCLFKSDKNLAVAVGRMQLPPQNSRRQLHRPSGHKQLNLETPV